MLRSKSWIQVNLQKNRETWWKQSHRTRTILKKGNEEVKNRKRVPRGVTRTWFRTFSTNKAPHTFRTVGSSMCGQPIREVTNQKRRHLKLKNVSAGYPTRATFLKANHESFNGWNLKSITPSRPRESLVVLVNEEWAQVVEIWILVRYTPPYTQVVISVLKTRARRRWVGKQVHATPTPQIKKKLPLSSPTLVLSSTRSFPSS